MLRFAPNLTMLFTEVPFLDRFKAAAQAGFKGVEFQFPYAYDIDSIAGQLEKYNLEAVLFNLPAGDWNAGDRGLAANPARTGEFQDGVGQAIDAARKLGVKQLNCLGGIAPEGVSQQAIYKTFLDNIRFAAQKLKAEGLRLLVEPVNNRDVPGAYLVHTQQAIDMIRDSGCDNVFLQHDIYHMQRMEGELANTIRNGVDYIKHIQIADNPHRHEPGTGEINYRFLFRLLDELGYEGWVGCEYHPLSTTVEGLDWIRTLTA